MTHPKRRPPNSRLREGSMILEKRPFPMWQCRGPSGANITYWMCAAIRDAKFFFSGSGPGRGNVYAIPVPCAEGSYEWLCFAICTYCGGVTTIAPHAALWVWEGCVPLTAAQELITNQSKVYVMPRAPSRAPLEVMERICGDGVGQSLLTRRGERTLGSALGGSNLE
jgi:hypothetical protein